MNKICTKCKKEKQETDFHWRSKEEGKRHSMCSSCRKVQSNRWYKKYGAEHRRKQKIRNKSYRDANQRYHYEILANNSCCDCGISDPVVLEFDHVRGIKKCNVSRLRSQAQLTTGLKEEIAKCDIVCANCHRIRTAKKQKWYKNIIKDNVV